MSIEIKMPTLSPTMTKGLIARWLVAVGDIVNEGDIIVEVETDKVTIEVEAEAAGVVSEICAEEGSEVPVDQVIIKMAEVGTKISTTTDKKTSSEISSNETANDESASEDAVIVSASASFNVNTETGLSEQKVTIDENINLSPLARRMAEQENIDITQLKGTGAKGKIVKRDIEKLMGFDESQVKMALIGNQESNTVAQIPMSPAAIVIDYDTLPAYSEIKNSGMRNVVAARLTESSRDIPHFYMTVDCEIDALLSLRKQLNNRENADYKISVNDFVIKAVASAMKKVPDANCMWAGASVLQFKQVDISIAVAVKDGLITPVVRNVNGKGLADISNDAKTLVGAARDGKLKPADYQGGTFTISNLGMFGIKEFTSIINPPQNGILSVGMGEQRAVVKDGELAIATVMSVTLAMDHRCVDGAIGARFIQAFKAVIEDPISLIL